MAKLQEEKFVETWKFQHSSYSSTSFPFNQFSNSQRPHNPTSTLPSLLASLQIYHLNLYQLPNEKNDAKTVYAIPARKTLCLATYVKVSCFSWSNKTRTQLEIPSSFEDDTPQLCLSQSDAATTDRPSSSKTLATPHISLHAVLGPILFSKHYASWHY